jgi:hypothetical protein
MADYGTLTMNYNTGTDASPTWTGTALAQNGSSGANELRMALSTGSQTGSTPSASWPYMSRPGSGTSVINQLWAFSADTTGSQIATYDGTNGKANVLRLSFSADGNPITAMQFSCFGDSTLTAPTAGTQPPTTHQDAFTNGQSSDTSSTSYVKINAYDQGLTSGGIQRTPSAGSAGTTVSATSGTAGAATPGSAAWLTTWQSAQGWIQYISGTNAPQASTAFFWYFTMIMYLGANISTGTWTPVFVLQYSYS